MLESVSDLIGECRQHAEDCARKAAAATDPRLKQEFFDMEQRWLRLVRSYEFTERILVRSYEFTERIKDFSDERLKDVCDGTERRADTP